MNVDVKIKFLENYDDSLAFPRYETEGSSGMDLRACLENREATFILPGERTLIATGFSLEIPKGYEIQIRSRSGLAYKQGIFVLNGIGTIDYDYRGEIKVLLCNSSKDKKRINHGERIAQMVLAPVTKMQLTKSNSLSETSRGEGGFGHSGAM